MTTTIGTWRSSATSNLTPHRSRTTAPGSDDGAGGRLLHSHNVKVITLRMPV